MGYHLSEVTRPRIWVIAVIFAEMFGQGKANLVRLSYQGIQVIWVRVN